MKKQMVVLGVAFALALPSLATTRTWVGGDSGSVTNKYCWDPAANPSQNKTDVWVFTNSAVVSTLDSNSNIYFAKIRLESEGINVSFKGDGRTMGISYSSCKTGELFVAAGSTLCFSNRFGCYQGSAVRKTGKGTVRFRDRCGYSNASGNWPCRPFIAEEGLTYLNPTGLSGSYGFFGDLVVKTGAEVRVSTYSVIADNTDDVTVEKGGLLKFEGNASSVDHLYGEGLIVGNGVNTALTIRMPTSDCGFYGTIENEEVTLGSGATYAFTVGASNTFKTSSLKIPSAADTVRFAPGVGDYWFKSLSGASGASLVAEDTDGEPVRLHLGGYTSTIAVSGAGDVVFTGTTTLKGSNFVHTGALVAEGELTVGDGTAANDADLSTYGSIQARGASVSFKNVGETVVPGSVDAAGEVTVSGPMDFEGAFVQRNAKKMIVSAATTFGDLRKDGGYFYVRAPVTMTGGEWRSGEIVFDAANASLTVTGGLVYGGRSASYMNQYESMFHRERRYGAYFTTTADHCLLDVAGGHFIAGNSTGGFSADDFMIRDGGVLTMLRGPQISKVSTTGYHLDFNGGTLLLPTARNPYGWVPFAASEGWLSRVGEKGGVIEVQTEKMYYDNQPVVSWYVESRPADGVTADGGLVFRTAGNLLLSSPQNLTGPVSILDGRFSVMDEAFTKADKSATDAPLGTGNLTLGSVYFNANGGAGAPALRLASGEGSKLSYAGATVLSMRYDASVEPQSVVIGNASAAEPTLVRGGKGSCLYLRDPIEGTDLDGTHGTVKAYGGVALDGKGRVKDPVFAFTCRAGMGRSDVYRLDFTTYDADKGFTLFDGYTEGLEGGADSVALVDYDLAGTTSVAADTTREVAALSLLGDSKSTKPATLTIGANATVKVGNGTDPACVLVNSRGGSGVVTVNGAGTLDFGSSEGVIASNVQAGYTDCSTISAKIAGTGGVSFFGPFGIIYPQIALSGDNDYTGGTWIRGIKVDAYSATAFGRDTVTIGPGRNAGGSIRFCQAMTMANDFVVSGYGVRWYTASSLPGALWFHAPVTLTGDVRIEDTVRIGSYRAEWVQSKDNVGTFQGVVSGGSLQLMQSAAPVVFEGANTYTGGTEVVSSTLILRGPCSVGTGEVVLDNGVLRFENDAPITFTNDLDGVGMIELAGIAPVTFACKGLENLPDALKTLNPGSTVDFPTCTNCTVAIGEDGFDLGGATVTLGSLKGSGRIANGLLTVTGEIQPGGEGAVGTLTFAPGVLVADGATFVCEVGDEAVDKIVVENAFDLSGLSLRTVKLGGFRGAESIVAAETLTGEFAATEFAKKSHEVTYGDTAVTLSVGRGGLLIVR